jgi:hypothetical protein
LTREEALNEWYSSRRQLEELELKLHNLKKIIFSEQMVPESINRHKLNKVSNKAGNGKTQEAILKVLAEHGGKITAKEVGILIDRSRDLASVTLRRLVKVGMVNVDSTNSHKAYYSIAIHRSPAELNHE